MMEIFASCGLEICCYHKLNAYVKVYEVPLTLVKHDSDIKIKACTQKSLSHL